VCDVCAVRLQLHAISVIKIKNNFLIRNNLEISYYCLLLKFTKCFDFRDDSFICFFVCIWCLVKQYGVPLSIPEKGNAR